MVRLVHLVGIGYVITVDCVVLDRSGPIRWKDITVNQPNFARDLISRISRFLQIRKIK